MLPINFECTFLDRSKGSSIECTLVARGARGVGLGAMACVGFFGIVPLYLLQYSTRDHAARRLPRSTDSAILS